MISLGSNDARKMLGLGFGGREMEDTELEEGEACSYNNNIDEYVANTDPENDLSSLSYIDEKIKHVLGHFQKDFEGGVSAENLGSKYGGYGSFLRTPGWPHPKSPSKVQSFNARRSPNNVQLEDNRHNSASWASGSQSERPRPPTNFGTIPASKAQSSNDSFKQDVGITSIRADELASRCEFANKKAPNMPDQKTLKVRIKVGSDNLSTQKNAAIYSGLGLDASPSSSLDESPSESEGMYRETQDHPLLESPTSIIRFMTSFPVAGEALLSPLHDGLLRLIVRGKIPKQNKSVSGKVDGKLLGEKKAKSIEKNVFPVEKKSDDNKETGNDDGIMSKKEVDIDTLACEELVSKTLKLPILSNSYAAVDKVKNKGISRNRDAHDMAAEELAEPILTQEISLDNLRSASTRKALEEQKTSVVDDNSGNTRKDGYNKAEKNYDPIKADSYTLKGSKTSNSETVDLRKKKSSQKALSQEQDSMKLPPAKDHTYFGGKRKSKGGQGNGSPVAEVPKESLKVGSSMLKNKQTALLNNCTNKRDSSDAKLENPSRKAEDRYRDFFGDMGEPEQEENHTGLLEICSEDRLKEDDKIKRNVSAINSMYNDRLTDKKTEGFLASESCPKSTIEGAANSAIVNVVGTSHVSAAPVLIKENWVGCDKCQKWRLLPLSINPADLPEKWLCSMLNWLPGMNSCNVPEEETTKGVFALYQVPVAESQISLQNNPSNSMFRFASADVLQPDQNQRSFGSHAMPSAGRKKHGLKEISHAMDKDGPSPIKKNMQSSVRSGSQNDLTQSPIVGEPGLQHISKSSDLSLERHKNKQKEKHKVSDYSSDGGDAKTSKMKGKTISDQDSLRASKKIKAGSSHLAEEDWELEHGRQKNKQKEKHKVSEHSSDGGDSKASKMKGKRISDQDSLRASKKIKAGSSHLAEEDWELEHAGKGGPRMSNGLPTPSVGKDHPKHGEPSYKDSKLDKNRQQLPGKRSKDNVQVIDGSLELPNCDDGEVSRKRKVEECNDSHLYTMGNHLEDSRAFVKEEFSENEYRREKKARVSKSVGKDSSTSKSSGKQEKKSRHIKNHRSAQDLGSTMSQRSLDGTDALKRDFGSAQPSLAATSSSSKVSGSHKSKSGSHKSKPGFQETKGSPVESVSSSPMRIANPDKLTSTRKNVVGKHECRDAGTLIAGSPRRCSDNEDNDGSDRLGTLRNEKTYAISQHGSLESSILDFQVKDGGQLSGNKAKGLSDGSPGIRKGQFMNGSVDYFGQEAQYPGKMKTMDGHSDLENQNENHGDASRQRKAGKGSSRSKDRSHTLKSVSLDEQQDRALPYEVKPRDGRNKFQERLGVRSDESENRCTDSKESTGKLSGESSRRGSQSNFGVQGRSDAKPDATGGQDVMSTVKQSIVQDSNGEKYTKVLHPVKSDHAEIDSGRGSSLPLPPSGGMQNEMPTRCPRPVSGSQKGNELDGSQGDDGSKVQKQIKKGDHQNGSRQNNSRHTTSGGHKIRDVDAPSPLRKESSSQAANSALREAKDLKHLADRLKNAGSNVDSITLYFQATLKFLHSASLLESCNSESGKHGENIQSLQIYSSTAKLLEFCAHEYEKLKDMAAASLAYKCMEMAYLRVVYSNHANASRDRHELQPASQMVPPGESPSSSASDVDNLNHQTATDKVAFPKGISSPQIAGNHVISAQKRPNFLRLLQFTQDVNNAMEAARKSQLAFAAAKSSLGGTDGGEVTSSVKKALDFNFHDVEGLLHLTSRGKYWDMHHRMLVFLPQGLRFLQLDHYEADRFIWQSQDSCCITCHVYITYD